MEVKVIRKFILGPNNRTVMSVPFNEKEKNPQVKVRVGMPSHVKNLLKYNEVLRGHDENRRRIFRLHNQSSVPADIELVEYEN